MCQNQENQTEGSPEGPAGGKGLHTGAVQMVFVPQVQEGNNVSHERCISVEYDDRPRFTASTNYV